ncbi:hypothetical protein HYT57_04675, partial [Candidatus Woesearchaeota archaeon]|nr:hypothetical protein [Candidatus Woesearchaeota archaeon]
MAFTGWERTINGIEQTHGEKVSTALRIGREKPEQTAQEQYAKAREFRVRRGKGEETKAEERLRIKMQAELLAELNGKKLDVKTPESRAKLVEAAIANIGKTSNEAADVRTRGNLRNKVIAGALTGVTLGYGAEIMSGLGYSMDNYIPGVAGAKQLAGEGLGTLGRTIDANVPGVAGAKEAIIGNPAHAQ